MEREFHGFELDTPLGGLSIGRGYSHASGEDYFRGLAIGLPFGKLRVGWRVGDEGEPLAEPSPGQLFARHLAVAISVWLIAGFLNLSLDLSSEFIKWLVSIWVAVLALHLLQAFGLAAADLAIDRLKSVGKAIVDRFKKKR